MISRFYYTGEQETAEEIGSETSSTISIQPDYWPLQVTWHDSPAMSFASMDEFRAMARLAFGIKDPGTLGWECRRIPLAQKAEEDVIFRSNEAGTWIVRKPADPFEVRFG